MKFDSIDSLVSVAMAAKDRGMPCRYAVREALALAGEKIIAQLGSEQLALRLEAALIARENAGRSWEACFPGIFG